MAIEGTGIATYGDLCDQFDVQDTLDFQYDQCLTHEQIENNFPQLQIVGSYRSDQLVRFKDISRANEIQSILLCNALPDNIDIDDIYVGPYAEDGYAADGGDFDTIGSTLYPDSEISVDVSVPYGQSTFGICITSMPSINIDFENDGFNWGKRSNRVDGQLQYDTDAQTLWGNLPIGTIYLGTGYESSANYGPVYIGNTNELTSIYLDINNFRVYCGSSMYGSEWDIGGDRVEIDATSGNFPTQDMSYPSSDGMLASSWGLNLSTVTPGSRYYFRAQIDVRTDEDSYPGYARLFLIKYTGSTLDTSVMPYDKLADNSDGTYTFSLDSFTMPTLYEGETLILGLVFCSSDTDAEDFDWAW